MSNLALFQFEGKKVRSVGTPEKPELIAQDVCDVFEIKNARDALADFDDDEKGVATIYTLGGDQEMLTVTEAGLYRLIFKSRKAVAKRFQRWVFHEVLPTIRKTGGYGIPQPRLPSSYTDRALALADQLKQEKGLTYAQAISAARGLLKDEATALGRAAKARLAGLLPRQRGLLATFKREGSLTLHDLVHWLGFNEADMHQDLAELESRGLVDRFVDDDGQPYYRASQTDGTAIDQTPRLDRSVETAR